MSRCVQTFEWYCIFLNKLTVSTLEICPVNVILELCKTGAAPTWDETITVGSEGVAANLEKVSFPVWLGEKI